MKSKFFVSIFLFSVLLFSTISCCVGATVTKDNVFSDINEKISSDQESDEVSITTKKMQLVDRDMSLNWTIWNHMLGGKSAEEIAKVIYGKSDSASVTVLFSEMDRLGFPEYWKNKLQQTYSRDYSSENNNIGSLEPYNSGNNGKSKLTLNKGVIYDGSKVIGIWNGVQAYKINTKGKLVISPSYTNQVKEAINNGQTTNTKISTTITSKIVNFVNKVSSNKVVNSAVYSLSKIYTKTNKGTLAFKLITADITNNNFGAKKFTGSNVYISTNAIQNVLKENVSKKYTSRRNIQIKQLKSVVEKGNSILRVSNVKNNKWYFLTISKVSNKKVTLYDTKNSKKIGINSLTSYLKKNYKFSGTAITYNVKLGKTPNSKFLKDATGI